MSRSSVTAMSPSLGRAGRPSRRRQAERSSQTKAELIAATVAAINERGYAAVTVRDVADRAAVSTGAVQHHYPDKDTLILAVLASVRQRLLGGLQTRSDVGLRPAPQRARLLLRRYWSVVSSPEYQAVMQIMVGSTTSAEVSREVSVVLTEAETLLDAQWAQAFADTGRSQETLVHARRVALAALRGFALRGLHNQRDPTWKAERAALLRMIETEVLG